MLFKSLRNRVRQRADNWIVRHSPQQKGPIRLHRRRIFILPTRGCLYFGLMVIVMLLVAMNYSNSLGFVLTFLLAGAGLVGMHHTYRNLLALAIDARVPDDVFAGQNAYFPVILHNAASSTRYAVRVQCQSDNGDGTAETVDIPARGSVRLQLPVRTVRRGPAAIPRLRIHTEFPMGMFHAWGWARLDLSGIAYPAARGHAPLPPRQNADQSGETGTQSGREDFAGLRSYERGDPPRLIHWKAYARSGNLLIKQFHDPRTQNLWLDWQDLAPMANEARLSQLTRWILDAEEAGLAYGLRLPDQEITPARGLIHKQKSLRALALFEFDNAA